MAAAEMTRADLLRRGFAITLTFAVPSTLLNYPVEPPMQPLSFPNRKLMVLAWTKENGYWWEATNEGKLLAARHMVVVGKAQLVENWRLVREYSFSETRLAVGDRITFSDTKGTPLP